MSLSDYFYLGNFEKMKEIIKKFPSISKDPHGDMYNVIKDLNIKLINLFEKNDNFLRTIIFSFLKKEK